MSGEQKKLIYGVFQDELYFMPEELAKKHARIRHAVEEASTWGDLKKMVTRSEFNELKERYEFSCVADDKLTGDTEVDSFFLGEDFYEHPGAYMQEWLPEEIITQFGKQGISLMDGILTNFEPADEERIIKELEIRGYTCEHRHNLMAFAMGEYCETVPVDEFILKPASEKPKLPSWSKGQIEIIDSDPVPEVKAKAEKSKPASQTSAKKKAKPVKKTKPKSKKPPVKKKKR